MQSLNMVLIVAAALLLAFMVTLFAATRRPLYTEDELKSGKHPQGYFLSVGMVAGIALGVLAGLAFESMPIGMAIGIGIGLLFGQFLEKRFNDDAGPFTEEEQRERTNRKRVGLIAMSVLVFCTLASAVLYLNR